MGLRPGGRLNARQVHESEKSGLFEIATNISTPLMLAGFVAAAFFLLVRQILKKDLFPTLTRQLSADIIRLIIERLFTLSLIAMMLGFSGFVLKDLFVQPSQPSSPMQKSIIGHWQFDHLIGDDPHVLPEGAKLRLDSISFYPDNSFDARLTLSTDFIGTRMKVPQQITGEYKFLDEKIIKYSNKDFISSDEIFAVSKDELILYNPIKKYKQVFKRIK